MNGVLFYFGSRVQKMIFGNAKYFFVEQKISEIGTMQYGLKDLKNLALVTLLYCSRVRFLKMILKFTIFKEKIKVQKINVFMFLN